MEGDHLGRVGTARDQARGVGDVERILARVALRSARPRDLTRLCSSLIALPRLRSELAHCDSPRLAALSRQAGDYPGISDLLQRAIIENPPVVIRDGGVLAAGYDGELDELRSLSSNADQFLLEIAQAPHQFVAAQDQHPNQETRQEFDGVAVHRVPGRRFASSRVSLPVFSWEAPLLRNH